MTDFYVYLHKKKTTGEVFYVGKGTGRRAYNKHSRSKWWKNVVEKHGLIVEIYMNNLQEWYALELETELIAYYGREDRGNGCLVNITDGGEGISGYKYSKERLANWSDRHTGLNNPAADRNVYLFVNLDTRTEERCTRYEFKKKYGINPAAMFTTKRVVSGWCLKEHEDEVLNKKGAKDRKNYTFINTDGKVFSGTRMEFTRMYGIRLDSLFNGRSNFAKGWALFENKDKKGNIDRNIYTFVNSKTGEVFKGTRNEFEKDKNLSIQHLFGASIALTYKNWCLSGKYSRLVFYTYVIHNKSANDYFHGSRVEFEKLYPEIHSNLFASSTRTYLQGWKVIEKRPFCLYIP